MTDKHNILTPLGDPSHKITMPPRADDPSTWDLDCKKMDTVTDIQQNNDTYEKRWGKYGHTPALAIPVISAKGSIYRIRESTDGVQALVAEFTDKKLRILSLNEGKYETRAHDFDTPFTLEEVFHLKIKAWMPNAWSLVTAICHHNHNPYILSWSPIIGWSFAKLDIGSKQPQTIEEKTDVA